MLKLRRGIVVGKFFPLHRGHQLLIETALAHVDELTVGVYNSFISAHWNRLLPAHKRAGWISQLYPSVKNLVVLPEPVIGVPDEQKNTGACSPIYAKQVEFLGPFDYCFTSEEYGEPWAKALGCEHVLVDAARNLIPVSGTSIRENAYKYRGLIDPLVYRDLIRKVAFVGTESTGKSTLAKRMAEEYDTLWVHEYGRELWEDQNLNGSFPDFLKIGETQRTREQNAALHSNRFLFCDTNPWTTLKWSQMYYHGVADIRLQQLVEATYSDYLWVLCDNDFDWIQDGSRELEGNKAEFFQTVQRAELEVLSRDKKIDLIYLSGSLEERVTKLKLQLELGLGNVSVVV